MTSRLKHTLFLTPANKLNIIDIIDLMAKLMYWTELGLTDVSHKVATECKTFKTFCHLLQTASMKA